MLFSFFFLFRHIYLFSLLEKRSQMPFPGTSMSSHGGWKKKVFLFIQNRAYNMTFEPTQQPQVDFMRIMGWGGA